MEKKYNLNKWSVCNGIVNHQNKVLVDGSYDALCNIVRSNRADYQESLKTGVIPANYLLEYLNKHNKLFLDIDKCEINITNLKDELRLLYNEIDLIVGFDLDRSKYLVFYKDTFDGIVRSIHIINYRYSMTTIDASLLADQLINKNSILSKSVDNAVYHSGRQLFLPYNTKPINSKYTLIGLNPNDSKKHLFIEYPKPNFNRSVDKYIVSCTKNTETLKLNTETLNLNNETFGDALESIFISPDSEADILKIIMSIDIIHQQSPLWIQTAKLIKVMDNEELLNDFLTLSATKSKYSYIDNKKFISRLSKSSNSNYLRLPDIEPESAFKQLLRIINKLQNNKVYYFHYLNNHAVNIANYINNIYGYLDCNTITSKIDNYISLPEHLKKKANYSIEFCLENQIITYDCKTGFLTSDKSTEANNFIIDKIVKPIKKDKFFDEIYNGINTIEPLVNDFMNSGCKILSAEVFCGGGKSSKIQTPIVKQIIKGSNQDTHAKFMNLVQNDRFDEIDDDLLYEVKQLPRIIVITPRTSLNRKELTDKKDFNFISHLEIIKLKTKLDAIKTKESEIYKTWNWKYIIMCRYCNVICSPNSIEKVFLYGNAEHTEILRPTLLILDEFDSILQTFNFENTTYDNRIKKRINTDGTADRSSLMEMCYLHLLKMIQYSNKVLFLDAHINPDFFDLVLSHTDTPRTSVKNIKVIQNNFKDTKFILCDSAETLLDDYYNNFDKKLEVCCTSKGSCEKIFMCSVMECYKLDGDKYIKIKDESIMMISGEGVCYWNTTDPDKNILPEKFGLFKKVETEESNGKYSTQNKKLIYKKYDLATFHELVYQLKIIHTKDDDIKKLKDDFLLEYNKNIYEDYKITKFIRSPTITIGNSFEEKDYFYKVYAIICPKTITGSVVVQTLFRSRLVETKSILICGDRCKVKEPQYRIPLDKCKNIFDTQEDTGIATKYISPNDRHNGVLYHNEDIKLQEVLVQNFQLKAHSNQDLFNEVYSLLKYNFSDVNFKFLTLNDETDFVGDMNENAKVQKQMDMDNYKNVDILKLTDEEIKNLKELSKINSNALQEYIKHSRQVRYINFEDIENFYLLRNPLEPLDPVVDASSYEKVHHDSYQESVDYINNCFLVSYSNRYTTLRYFTDDEWNIKKDYYNDDYGISYTPFKDVLLNFHKNNYYNNINTDYTLNKYKFHTKEMSKFLSRTLLLKTIINYDNRTQITSTLEPHEKIVNHRSKMSKKKENIIRTLCLFLDIDLEQFQSVYYRYILDNTKHQFIIQFDTIFSESNIKETDGEKINFMEWINGVLIHDYNAYNKTNLTKLTSKNLKSILSMLKFYLKEINIEIDYETDSGNAGKYKCFQFVIKPNVDLKIITKPKLNPYYSCNPDISTMDSNGNEVIKYLHNFQNVINKNPVVKGITFLYRNVDDTTIINETLIIRPIKKLRKANDKSYYEDYVKKFVINGKPYCINNKVYRHDITIPNEKGLKQVKGKLENVICKRYIYTTNEKYNSHKRRSVHNFIVRQNITPKKFLKVLEELNGVPAHPLPYTEDIINLDAPACVIIKDKDDYNAKYLVNVVEVFKSTLNHSILNC